jgi:MFS family permease
MRAAVTAVFFLTGLVYGTWAARIPAVQAHLGLSAGALGAAVLAIEAGAVLGLPLGGALTARWGPLPALRAGFAFFAPALTLLALAGGLAPLAASLAVWAAANSVIDVAMNAQGVELERRAGRPLLSGLHAGHSFGLLAGGAAATAAAAAGAGVAPHFAAVSAVALVGALAATRVARTGAPASSPPASTPRLAPPSTPACAPRRSAPATPLSPPASAPRRRARVAPPRRFAALGAIAFCAFLIDGTADNWAAVHLRSLGAAPATAAGGFSAFALAVACTRLAGDRLVARAGRRRAVELAGAVAAAGAALAVAAQAPAVAFAGWAILGAGVAVIAPVVLGAAPDARARPAAAIAAVTTVGYLGSFTGPPLIGLLAQLSGLRAALTLVLAVALVAAALARRAL